MMKGKSDNAYYMKELMRLLPISDEASRAIFLNELELRDDLLVEEAEKVRAVKIALYDFSIDCRLRNMDLIAGAPLNARQLRMIRFRYIKGYTWKQLFGNQGYSSHHCKRIHRDAITKIAEKNKDIDFRPLYEQERAKLDGLLAQVNEKRR